MNGGLAGDAKHAAPLRVAIAGNPNCGKTSVFNVLTGTHQHVGNWPGVTVERKAGEFSLYGKMCDVLDLPGTYALTAYSIEERVVEEYLLNSPPDILLNVVDASNLERHLLFTAQLTELGIPMVLVLNMVDEARAQGVTIDLNALSQSLDMPVVSMVARYGTGRSDLLRAIDRMATEPRTSRCGVAYSEDMEAAIGAEVDGKALSRVRAIMKLSATEGEGSHAGHQLLEQWHAFARGIAERSVAQKGWSVSALTERLDNVLTRPVLGLAIFGVFMWLAFQTVFTLGQFPAAWIESGFDALARLVAMVVPAGGLQSLLVDAVIKGVGGVLVFLPNIVLLFLVIGFMEDSGYMARAAFVTDRLMHRFGLHGKSCIPLLLGFGCNIPAIMVTRSLDTPRERLVTALIVPFMSCSARLPVYTLFISAFFPVRWQAAVLLSLYALGILAALVSARLLGALLFRKEQTALMIELPPYRLPMLRSTLLLMWSRAWQYIKKAGTVLLGASVVMWYLCTHPAAQPGAYATERFAASYASKIGAVIEPVLRPLGFDNRIAVALVTGFAAKEAVVSTMGVMYGGEQNDTETDHLVQHVRNDHVFAGRPLQAYVLMVFVLLYVPCLGVITVFWREFGLRWAIFMTVYACSFAWLVALLIRSLGMLAGF